MNGPRLAALLAVLATPALLTPAIAPAAPPADGKNVLQCEGAFARDSSHAKLVQAFGKGSVAFLDVEGAEGEKLKASVVYPAQPASHHSGRLQVTVAHIARPAHRLGPRRG